MASAAAVGEAASLYLSFHLQDRGTRVYRLVPAWMSSRLFWSENSAGLPELATAVQFAAVRNGRVVASISMFPAGEVEDDGELSGENKLEIFVWPPRVCIKMFKGPEEWQSTSLYFTENVIDSREIGSHGHHFLGWFSNFEYMESAPLKMKIGSDITIDNQLGSGAQGTVFRCSIFNHHQGAIKIYWENEKEGEPLEVNILSKLHHPNILQLYLAWKDASNKMYICTEFCERELSSYINTRSENQVVNDKRLFMEIVSALQEAHKIGIVHRDLKPYNILLDTENSIRLIDFGHSAFMPADKLLPKGAFGTKLYQAPELRKHLPHDEKVDIFSLGLIYHEIFASKERFRKLAPERKRFACLKKIRNKLHFSKNWGHICDIERAWNHYSFAKEWSGDVALLAKMVSLRSSDRPSADQIMEMLVAEK